MENYCEEENNLFFKKLRYVASLFTFFEKSQKSVPFVNLVFKEASYIFIN